MKLKGSILAVAAAAVLTAAPAAGLCQEVKGTKPEEWLQCFAATKLHQDAMAGSGKFSLNVVMQAGEPRLRYQRLAKTYLARIKKLDPEAVSGEMVKAPADLKKNKTGPEIEDLARSCTENLPNLADPKFYDKYEFLRDEYKD
jgi:hypothetical protein